MTSYRSFFDSPPSRSKDRDILGKMESDLHELRSKVATLNAIRPSESAQNSMQAISDTLKNITQIATPRVINEEKHQDAPSTEVTHSPSMKR